jgi:UDP-GlcNAc:undecaprenyl-phosphate GlcNAc-1-phosphate transferase
MMLRALLVALVAFLVAFLVTPLVRRLALARGVVDVPDEPRRVHKEPTPRWGGLALFAAVAVGFAAAVWAVGMGPPAGDVPQFLGLLLVGTAVMLMGALDDKYDFSAGVQLVFLLACGVAVQFAGVQITGVTKPWPIQPGESSWLPLGIWAWPVTALWMFVVTKTMDTIDGLDGLAAGISAIAAATLAIMALQSSPTQIAVGALAATVCGASLGFLKHNYNPAKIFMGTGGAQFLGFVLAGVSVIGAFKVVAAVTMGVPLLVFGLPILDAFFVVIRRLRHRQPIYRADTRHLHHRLLRAGLSHRQAVLVLYAVALVLCLAALWMFSRAHGAVQAVGDGKAHTYAKSACGHAGQEGGAPKA